MYAKPPAAYCGGRLLAASARVRVYDPTAKAVLKARLRPAEISRLILAPYTDDALTGAGVLATGWKEFSSRDFLAMA